MFPKNKIDYKNLINLFLPYCNSEIIAQKLIIVAFALKYFSADLLNKSSDFLFLEFEFLPLKFWKTELAGLITDYNENPNIVYEKLLLISPNQTGSFFTPQKLAEKLIRKVYLEKQQQTILDPSCGTGIFFQEILLQSKDPGSVVNKIYGYDINPDSLEFCAFFLNLVLHKKGFKSHNFKNQLVRQNGLTSQNGKYDLVIGNPPYGISRNNQISKEELENYRNLFPEISKDKLNKYILFTYKYYHCLTEKGLLAFIIPNAWLGIKSSKEFRKFLFQKKAIKELEIIGSEFEARVETVILILNNSRNEIFKIINKDKIKEKKFESELDYKIRIHFSNASDAIIQSLNSKKSKITDHFQPMIAIQPYAVGKGIPKQTLGMVKGQIYHSNSKLDQDYLPYLDGKDINRYFHLPSKKYLKYGKNLSEYQPIERFNKPRILIREIVNKLPYVTNACICSDILIYNKSVLHIQGESSALKALLHILNSKLGGLILYLSGNKIQRRLFPKLVIDDLKNFPLPDNFLERITQINSTALNQIDSKIAEVYGIREDLIEKSIYEELNS